ncbi:hypothetical protein SODALDRAFT_353842 [Sodiomyces alkalinus F11]|uniref:Uncharacterized protein n=1 Tax=Sodiomyces alkalinus (strain CBS 110278 / VKM F-3762 / F11) TaxID=1314773 RepID=A0A3N2PJ19_SODAK|nr:hypothetical protein SODALDRAFT_353842 [Sodiomyces alkalinus F11]ROT34541.1 hypothetical protein SODALDRAFT_353842 [Sodiomyces alkalinus F11]
MRVLVPLVVSSIGWALVDALPHGSAAFTEVPLTNTTGVTVTVSVPGCTTTTITLARSCTSWAPFPSWAPTQSVVEGETSVDRAQGSVTYTTDTQGQPVSSTLPPLVIPTSFVLTETETATWYSDYISSVEPTVTETILPSSRTTLSSDAIPTWTNSSVTVTVTATQTQTETTTEQTTLHSISTAQPSDAEPSESQSTVTRTVVVVVTTVVSTTTYTPSTSSSAFFEVSSALPVFSDSVSSSALLNYPTETSGGILITSTS